MKKMNLLVMSLVSAAALSFSSCSSNDDLAGGGTQSQADGVYMTLSIAGSNQSTRTEGTVTNPGIDGESTITEGTLYLYSNKTHECVFRKVITSTMFDENIPNKTKPIKISVNSVNTKDTYTVYFMANKTGIDDPLATNASFTISEKGGAEYGLTEKSKIVMFNQNDHSKQANHSTVQFTADNNVSTNPATAGTVYLDRVVARIDEPTVAATNITSAEGNTKNTENVTATIAGIKYQKYAISNVNNNSYIVQKWSPDFSTLSVKWGDTETKYFQPTSFFGDAKAPANLNKFGNVKHNYVFENTTTDASEATALYFQIKANLTTEAATNADFADGTFYRYDKKLYTRIADIFKDAEKGIVSNPFTESGETTAADVVASIKDASDNLISDEGEGGLNEFRNKYKIEVFRAGSMYYYYPIQDNTYKTATTSFSVLRNSIYQLNVTKISEVGKDIPNGPTPDENNPNYYMTVQVQVNPWILNTKDIELK